MKKYINIFISHPMSSVSEKEALRIRNRIAKEIIPIKIDHNYQTYIKILDNYNLESKSDTCPKASILGQALETMAQADIIIMSKEAVSDDKPFGCMVELELARKESTKAIVLYEGPQLEEELSQAINTLTMDLKAGNVLIYKSGFRSITLYFVLQVREDGIIVLSEDMEVLCDGKFLPGYSATFIPNDKLSDYLVIGYDKNITDKFLQFRALYDTVSKKYKNG